MRRRRRCKGKRERQRGRSLKPGKTPCYGGNGVVFFSILTVDEGKKQHGFFFIFLTFFGPKRIPYCDKHLPMGQLLQAWVSLDDCCLLLWKYRAVFEDAGK